MKIELSRLVNLKILGGKFIPPLTMIGVGIYLYLKNTIGNPVSDFSLLLATVAPMLLLACIWGMISNPRRK